MSLNIQGGIVNINQYHDNSTEYNIDARGKDLDDWQFEVTDQAGALGIPRIIGGSTLQQTINNQKTEEEIMLKETVRVLKGIIYPPNKEYFSNIVKQAKKELRVGEEKAKKYASLLYDQAVLIAGLPLDDPSAYTDLVCELIG